MQELSLHNPGVLALWMAHKAAKHPDNEHIHEHTGHRALPQHGAPDKHYEHWHYKHLITRQTEEQSRKRHPMNITWLHRVFCQPHHCGTAAHVAYRDLFEDWGTNVFKTTPHARLDMETLSLLAELMVSEGLMPTGTWHKDNQTKRKTHPIRDLIAELEVLASQPSLLDNPNVFKCYRTPSWEGQRGGTDSVSTALLVTDPMMTEHIDNLYDDSNQLHHRFIRNEIPLIPPYNRYVTPKNTECFEGVNARPSKLRAYQFIPDCLSTLCEFEGWSQAKLARDTYIREARMTKFVNDPSSVKLNLQELCALADRFKLPLSLWITELTRDCYNYTHQAFK